VALHGSITHSPLECEGDAGTESPWFALGPSETGLIGLQLER